MLEGGTDRGSSCGLSAAFLLQSVWNSGNTGTSDLQPIQAHKVSITNQKKLQNITNNLPVINFTAFFYLPLRSVV